MTILMQKSSFRFERMNKVDHDCSNLQILSFVCLRPEIPRAKMAGIVNNVYSCVSYGSLGVLPQIRRTMKNNGFAVYFPPIRLIRSTDNRFLEICYMSPGVEGGRYFL